MTATSRAHQRFLGVDQNPQGKVPVKVQTVTIAPRVAQFFQAKAPIEVPMTGPLFGQIQGSHHYIQYPALQGYSNCLSQADPLFQLDESYLLGWMDALHRAASPSTDWIGHWIALPRYFDEEGEDVEQYIDQAREAHLIDPYHILLFVHFIPKLAMVPRVFDRVTRYIPIVKSPRDVFVLPELRIIPTYDEVPSSA